MRTSVRNPEGAAQEQALLPIVLNETSVIVGLAGAGEALERRRVLLKEAGVVPVTLPLDGRPLPNGLKFLYIAGIARAEAAALAAQARAAGSLVNVEDVPDLCDFHAPATVRRGDLLVTVSTAGRAPGLARLIREWLSAKLGSEWSRHLETVSERRAQWRSQGLAPQDVSQRVREFVAERNWLS
jgi:precorrin-2 dehydrogenase/sirohydrochlorin ferrochelatase